MDTKCLKNLSSETQAALGSIATAQQGLQNYLAASHEQLVQVAKRYSMRRDLLNALNRSLSETLAAIESLVADGHPGDPDAEFTRRILNLIEDEDRQEAEARAKSRERLLNLRALLGRIP
jgi:hypothetical protein